MSIFLICLLVFPPVLWLLSLGTPKKGPLPPDPRPSKAQLQHQQDVDKLERLKATKAPADQIYQQTLKVLGLKGDEWTSKAGSKRW